MKTVVVREYAHLTTDSVVSSLDRHTVTPSAFEWLCNLAARVRPGGASLLQIEGRRLLRLDNYVGVLETPCGTVIEILPKHVNRTDEQAAADARSLLIKMLSTALDLPTRGSGMADISLFRYPLLEWVMKQFVAALDVLVKRGLRSDYRHIEEEQRFLRGRLDAVKQMRQPPGRNYVFNIRHDLFIPDRPENRLLKTALARVCKLTQQVDTWRLSHELIGILGEIPLSQDTAADFLRWQDDRLMAHYGDIRPWCELVLGQHMPLSVRGMTRGMSLLFPMERLFERFVEAKLRPRIAPGYSLKAQSRDHSLCVHGDRDFFQLRPDLVVLKAGTPLMVLDTKWKLIDARDGQNKYGLSQADFYQLFAYGQKYLGGKGEVMLIYPRTASFMDALKPFHFSPELTLHVVPFDLKNETFNVLLPWLVSSPSSSCTLSLTSQLS